MALIDLSDETFIAARPAEVSAAVHDWDFMSRLWPGLQCSVGENRAANGIRWDCTGPLIGTAEVWLEPFGAGVIVHAYLRVDPHPGWKPRRIRREARRRELQVKSVMFALKDRLELPTSMK